MAIASDVIERAKARVGMLLVDKYRLDRLLGIGGMAAVYAATHRNKKRVAIKILHPELSIDEMVKTRFLREGYAANTVEHPGAVAVFDDDVTPDGSAFLVMELLVGETLDGRAERKGGTLGLGEVLALTDQLLDVLAAAHEKGLVHRDIKPDNLFLTASGQLKVLDFGIARLRELNADAKATGVGSFMGTPAFMSPEQARGRWDEVDLRSDVWAAGATMFNLLTGRTVHETDSVGEQLVMAATVPAQPLISLLPRIEPIVAEVVDRALAFDRAARWPNVPSMQAALKQAIAVVAPEGDLSVPKTSIPALDVNRNADTLAISDTFAVGQDSGASGPARDSPGGSLPSTVTSRTGSDREPRPRHTRAMVVAGGAVVAAVGAMLLWPRTPVPNPEPASGIVSTETVTPVATAATATNAKPGELEVVPLATSPGALDSGAPAARSASSAKPPVSAARLKGAVAARPGGRAAPPAAPSVEKPASPGAPSTAPSRKDDPLSKRY